MAVSSSSFLHVSNSTFFLPSFAPISFSSFRSSLSCCHVEDHALPLAASSRLSPFTERHSLWRVRGGGRLQQDDNSTSSTEEETQRDTDPSSEFRELSDGRLVSAFQKENANIASGLPELPDDQFPGLFSFDGGQTDIRSRLPQLHELVKVLRARIKTKKSTGNVFLVGTGPGDPELLTLKALSLMQTADLVLYDRLVSTDILDLVHAGAVLLYVGKTAGYHTRTQDEIHQLLMSFADAGATILRLKGGDPLVFGRGGEEMDFLQQQGIEVKIVPGITAASGIAAELGIPLTHRGAANSVQFLTGHSTKGGTGFHLADQAANPEATLVIYMGLATISCLSSKLIADGLPSDTPAAAIERGTTAQQRTVFAKLKDLATEVASAHLVSPTLIIIGRVVALSPFWPFRSLASASASR